MSAPLRHLALALLLALPLCASAGPMGPLIADQPLQWQGATLAPGMAEAQVRKAVGRHPDHAAPLFLDETGQRDAIGQRWMYLGDKRDRRTLWIEFTHGRVSRLWTEVTDDARPLSER